ncbi:peptidase inhibitor family I36 protein [Streptomyces syringium]|uniref:peptidase inhibitor family I36 protein n=1 Tax=Streptomyces syringium TaxID=76729 RepID=UPI0034232D30
MKRQKLLFGAASVLIGGFFAASASAQSQHSPDECPDKHFCVWSESNYEGKLDTTHQDALPPRSCTWLGVDAKSVVNNTDYNVNTYSKAGGGCGPSKRPHTIRSHERNWNMPVFAHIGYVHKGD